MKRAHQSIRTTVESLQPKIVTIPSRLATEFLKCLYKKYCKARHVKKYEDDVDYIPKPARVKFTLKCSKLAEQDKEYTSPAVDTVTITETLHKDLRQKVVSATELEVKLLKVHAIKKYAKHLPMTVKACLACEPMTQNVNVDNFVQMLLYIYDDKLFVHLGTNTDEFRTVYNRIHSITHLLIPFVTSPN